MANPWDIPLRASRGDGTPTALFTAVGQAMSAWELIEFDLSEMFAIFTGSRAMSKGTEPALRAYGTIISFRTRSDILNAAAKAFFRINKGTRLERPFKNVLKKCNGWAERRNDIAHGVVLRTDHMTRYLLWPSPYNAKKYPIETGAAAFQYRASQIRKFVTAFRQVRRQTKKLVQRLDDLVEERQKHRRLLAE